LSWEPATRLVLSWDIIANWQYDPELKTEVEVRFIVDGKNGTRVELAHRRLDRYGERRDEMRAIFETQGTGASSCSASRRRLRPELARSVLQEAGPALKRPDRLAQSSRRPKVGRLQVELRTSRRTPRGCAGARTI